MRWQLWHSALVGPVLAFWEGLMSMPGQTSVLNNYLCLSLLYDVDRICKWISSNHLTINVAKFKSMCISRSCSSKLRFTILVNSSPLEKVKCFKYLGLWISDDLTWSCHIESVCCRARQQLWFIYRFFPLHCDAGTILALYKSHVLPMLDYACIVWDPHLRKDQLLLESVQHFALKIASQTWTRTTRLFVLVMIWLHLWMGDRTLNSLLHLSLFMVFLYCPDGYFLFIILLLYQVWNFGILYLLMLFCAVA